VIAARKLSSAMSAAKATCDHLRDWWHGTKDVSSSTDMSTYVYMQKQIECGIITKSEHASATSGC